MRIRSLILRLIWKRTTDQRRRSGVIYIAWAVFISQVIVILVIVGKNSDLNLINGKYITKLQLKETDEDFLLNNNKNLNIKAYENTPINKNYINISNTIPQNFKTENHFKPINKKNPGIINLKEDENVYFKKIHNIECFIQGTDFLKSNQSCSCLRGYYGEDCGIPEAVWFSKYRQVFPKTGLKRRKLPRRVIHGFPVHHEFSMFEARIHELYDVVDVFIIAESNYTSHRDPKSLEFYDRFENGYLREFQNKFLYLMLGFPFKYGSNNGWMSDQFIRYYLGMRGMSLIKKYKDDDLFMLTDSDELPTKDIVTFLKLYDGYSEPIGFAYKWNVFGFFWKYPADASFSNWYNGIEDKLSIVYSVSTIKMLREVFKGNVFYIRKEGSWKFENLKDSVDKYRREGNSVEGWIAGNINHYAGWHCSWCFSPHGIIKKMDAAQAEDKPRWGDYPEKKNISYIKSVIYRGRWFDEKIKFLHASNKEKMYAPNYLLANPSIFHDLLFHPNSTSIN